MSYAVGSLVRARDREWVVLPESEGDLLVLRPLGGTDDETTGIYLPLEKVEQAQFDLPRPDRLGDYQSCRLLARRRSPRFPLQCRAVSLLRQDRLRAAALPACAAADGPEARPGTLADCRRRGHRQDGRSVPGGEGTARPRRSERLAVLCPPHLAEQWQAELRDKFHIDAELVLSSTVSRLERNCSLGRSLFELYPHVVVSIDFIKSDRRRDEFLRTCPELVIVDEAHTCAFGGLGRGGRHQRHQLLTGLASDEDRHLLW